MNNQVPALLKFGSGPTGNVGANDPKPNPLFKGFTSPSIDMDAVRDGRRAPLLYVDVPLDSTFSIAGGNPVILPISGNSFYIDQDTSVAGVGYVHFQDTNLQSASAPVFVGAGFIANVPFTKILIENKLAQPGKILRIIYGVDVDFTAGVNATIAVTDQAPVRFAGVSTAHTVTATAANIVPANASRKFAMIQNNGTIDIYIAIGAVATTANGFKLSPGGTMTFDAAVSTNAFSAITAGGTNSSIVHLFG